MDSPFSLGAFLGGMNSPVRSSHVIISPLCVCPLTVQPHVQELVG